MDVYRLRLQLDDQPGRLGRLASALGGLGVNILDVDIHSIDGSHRADELLIDLTRPVDLPALEHAVRRAGSRLSCLHAADPHELVDSDTRCLELARAMINAGAGTAPAAEAARRLVRAELCWIATESGVALTGVAGRALEDGAAHQAREPVKRLVGARSPWSLAVPFATDGSRRVLVLVRRSPSFSFTETARVRALLGVGAAAGGGTDAVTTLRDGGSVTVRQLRPADAGALVRLHRRCSPETRYRRYFSPMVDLPDHVLAMLLDVDDADRTAVVAATGSETVGVAHAFRAPGAPSAEVAFLVEDAHQRRGIGTAMLRRLAARVAGWDVNELTALALPGNVAPERLLRAAGWETATSWESGLVRVRARMAAANSPPSVPSRR